MVNKYQMYCADINKRLVQKKKEFKLKESEPIMKEINELIEISYEMNLTCNINKDSNCDCCKDMYEKIFGTSESCWEKLNKKEMK